MTTNTEHSARRRATASTTHRFSRRAEGLRVWAMLVGVAVLSGRVTLRAKPHR